MNDIWNRDRNARGEEKIRFVCIESHTATTEETYVLHRSADGEATKAKNDSEGRRPWWVGAGGNTREGGERLYITKNTTDEWRADEIEADLKIRKGMDEHGHQRLMRK